MPFMNTFICMFIIRTFIRTVRTKIASRVPSYLIYLIITGIPSFVRGTGTYIVYLRNIVDYDPSSNSGGWQWSASIGSDATLIYHMYRNTYCTFEGTFIRTKVRRYFRPTASFIL